MRRGRRASVDRGECVFHAAKSVRVGGSFRACEEPHKSDFMFRKD